MKLDSPGLAFIAEQEGCVLHVYDDITGKPTIGVGHLLKPGESFPNGVTHEQAMDLLAQDAAVAEADVNACVKVSITQNQFSAICDFCFNEGGGALASSTMLHLLNAGMVDKAADALLLWDKDERHAVLVVDQGLLKRRQAERALFLTPDTEPSEAA